MSPRIGMTLASASKMPKIDFRPKHTHSTPTSRRIHVSVAFSLAALANISSALRIPSSRRETDLPFFATNFTKVLPETLPMMETSCGGTQVNDTRASPISGALGERPKYTVFPLAWTTGGGAFVTF